MNVPNTATLQAPRDELSSTIEKQRMAFLAEGPPRADVRARRIDTLMLLLLENADVLAEAMREDFGNRSPAQSIATDVFGVFPSIKHTRKHFKRWMKVERVSAGLVGLTGGRARIHWQPKGVVGIISPWNFPVALAIQPLAEALAAGNRAMVKVSEFTPRTSELLKSLFEKHFDPAVVSIVTGGPEVGAAFSQLPFDHIFFTGAPSVGRHIQRAAADNLVPVTLELGGKCPVVVAPDADLDKAAAKIAMGKTLNAGQICLSPDYVFVPEGKEAAFTEAVQHAIAQMFPRLLDNPDYCSIIADRHYRRLQELLDDAGQHGAEIIPINPGREAFTDPAQRKIPPTLVLGANRDMQLLKEEIFGPILPVLTYSSIDEVIDWVNAGERPLATYYFGSNNAACKRYLERTHSGGAVMNDVFIHAMVDELPFGGVGHSGMGSYHGQAGFKTFSHARGVVKAGFLSPNKVMTPPYSRVERLLNWMLKRELTIVRRRLQASQQENPS